VGLAEVLIDSVSGGAEDPLAPMQFRRADELTRRAELLRPDDAYVMYVRLYLLAREWRWSEAIAAAQRAIEIHPSLPGAHFCLGTCLIPLGRAADAVAKFKEAFRLRPRSTNNCNRYRTMGEALIFLGEYEEAISWLRRSLAANPTQSSKTRGFTLAAIAAAKAISGQAEEARLSASEALRLRPTLTAQGYYQTDTTNPTHAAEVSRLRDGLRLAGVRDHADEDADFGAVADDALHTDYEGPTPTSVPGARIIRTPSLARLVKRRRLLVLDTGRTGMSVPRAIGLWGSGIGGSISDDYQDRLGQKMQQLTSGDQRLPIVTFAWNAERYLGRNLALRLVALGYTNVHWYRGGREAWEVAGLPETELAMQDW
jgi:tetratricopeptide (TPR) repeat protein